ncbi:MAG: DUF3881 family protein [Clostridiales bacterium]|jgi:hypothetical protein|nr:DUF3881 family protein [Clostridiales bacterium]
MNKNISAIGFKSILNKRKALSDIIRRISDNPDKSQVSVNKNGRTQLEQYGYIGESFGLVLYAARGENGETKVNRWHPFAVADQNMRISNVSFEKMQNGSIFAYCEDASTGTELEFRLNNQMDFETLKAQKSTVLLDDADANIIALGKIGNIIFPIEKNEDAIRMREEENETRRNLLSLLRKGDETAEQKLYEHSVEIASAVHERLKTEDVLSVFEGYCLPYGTTDGTFALLGDIIETDEMFNRLTDETVYSLMLDVTGVSIQLLINQNDVVGMPISGMRFMVVCDLQGSIRF